MTEQVFGETDQDNDQLDLPNFSQWLNSEMKRLNISIAELAEKTGISYPGVWNIVKGNTTSPREDTRRKISAALNTPIPTALENAIEQEQILSVPGSDVPGYQWSDFTPSALDTVPDKPGIYVFYDITGRPVYVGKSNANVRARVKDHQTRFWFKQPLVVRGAFLAIDDKKLCDTIEMVLIKFLGSHALLNEKGVTRDIDY